MNNKLFVHVVTVFLLAACAPRESKVSDFELVNELRMLTGADARECGLVRLNQASTAAWECARKAMHGAEPFWFAVERVGIDSEVWIAGLRASDGVVYVLEYDSNFTGGADPAPRFSREACLGELVFELERTAVIQCKRRRL